MRTIEANVASASLLKVRGETATERCYLLKERSSRRSCKRGAVEHTYESDPAVEAADCMPVG
jgi:hypothetical protein